MLRAAAAGRAESVRLQEKNARERLDKALHRLRGHILDMQEVLLLFDAMRARVVKRGDRDEGNGADQAGDETGREEGEAVCGGGESEGVGTQRRGCETVHDAAAGRKQGTIAESYASQGPAHGIQIG